MHWPSAELVKATIHGAVCLVLALGLAFGRFHGEDTQVLGALVMIATGGSAGQAVAERVHRNGRDGKR